jgi:ribonucleotide reductase alpha subunit
MVNIWSDSKPYVDISAHVKRLLLERYSFQIPENLAIELPNTNTWAAHYREEEKDGGTIQIFDDPNDPLVFFEGWRLIARRVAKRIALGLLFAVADEANKEFITGGNLQRLAHMYLSDDKDQQAEAVKILNTWATVWEDRIYRMQFIPSSPFLFNSFRAVMDIPEVMQVVYLKPGEMTYEHWDILVSQYATRKGQSLHVFQSDPAYGSCYAMGSIEDDTKAIYDMLYKQAEIFRHAGGFGVNFSKLRSKWAYVKTIKGRSSGAVSFMQPFNQTTALIALTSRLKRGANMFILNYNHPEIEQFINAKTDYQDGYKNLQYANISVGIDDDFVQRVLNGDTYEAVDPHDKNIRFTKDARRIWSNIILNATLHAEPGLVNFSAINRDYVLSEVEPITSTNPCSEFVSRDQSVCVLGSVNLYAFVNRTDDGQFVYDFEGLAETVKDLHKFLTFANFANAFPFPELTRNTRLMRNTGVGYMGLASTLVLLGLRYGSQEAKEFFKQVMETFSSAVISSSLEVAEMIGPYPEWQKVVAYFEDNVNNHGREEFGTLMTLNAAKKYLPTHQYDELAQKFNPNDVFYAVNKSNAKTYIHIGSLEEENGRKKLNVLRAPANMRLMAIAPTGSISFIAGISSGVEPIFYAAYKRKINPGLATEYETIVVDRALVDYLKYKAQLSDKEIDKTIEKITKGEQVALPDYFVTHEKISLIERLRMLYTSASFIDMNTSVTFNISRDAKFDIDTIQELKNEPEFNKAIEKFSSSKFDIMNYIFELAQNEHTRNAIIEFITRTIDEDAKESVAQEIEKALLSKDVDNPHVAQFIQLVSTVSTFYLLAQLLGIKGTTVYVEGSRTPVLKAVKKEKKAQKKEAKPMFVLNVDDKPRKAVVKERPGLTHSLKRQVKFKLKDNLERTMYVELGMYDGDEPFEVFFRPTKTTSEYAGFFALAGRLMSIAIRSGVPLQDLLEQMRKVKNYNMEPDPVVVVMYEALNELWQIAQSKGTKRKELLAITENTQNWIMSPKGYYIDTEGKKRCPVCKSYVNARDGCIDCPQCGWTACS